MKNALVTKVPCIPSSPVEKLNGVGVVALHVVFAKPFVGHLQAAWLSFAQLSGQSEKEQ